MIKFNDDNIFTGYIKQLLHTFNLPNVRIYKSGCFLYDGELFIKDNFIQRYDADKKAFSIIMPYSYNKTLLNYTDNLKINSLLYDSHTHEYLGEYLRFIRDFHDFDLMSMYNCFSNNIVTSIKIKWGQGIQKTFESDPVNFKVYSIPVKLGKKYTIAVSSIQPLDFICCLYSKSLIEDKTNMAQQSSTELLADLTYKKISLCDFKKPFIYDALTDPQLKNKFLYDHEKYLRLLIKVPNNNRSSIVVLEGEYLNTNQKYPNKALNGKWEHASTVINYDIDYTLPGQLEPALINADDEPTEYSYYDVENELITQVNNIKDFSKENEKSWKANLVTSLQLLELNSNISYAFADRLIEYLTKNVVDRTETISDNIQRLQEELIRRREESFDEDQNIYVKRGITHYKKAGIWEDRYRNVLYDIASQEGLLDSEFDILGYMDKDIESKLGNDIDIYSKE